MRIILDLWSRDEAGDKRHAQKIIKDLGIIYKEAIPQPIADSWQFKDCTNIPTDLPDYVIVKEDNI